MPRPVTHRRDNADEWFWSQTDRSTGCWLWTGSKTKDGYGIVYFEGRSQTVSSIAYQLSKGPIPEGREVIHDCPGGDRPACIHPEHILAATHSDNMLDAYGKGRRTYRGVPAVARFSPTFRNVNADIPKLAQLRDMVS